VAACRTARDPVLLVDANLDAPSVAGDFSVVAGPGVRDLLAGDADLDDCLHPGGHERLFLLTAGKPAGDGAGLWEPGKVGELLGRLKERFGWIVVDLPAVAKLSPGVAMAGRLDGVLLVIEAGRVRADAARRAKRQLTEEGARLLGVVLNKERSAA
jgi:Mrp family chromosome partitioning ATPase